MVLDDRGMAFFSEKDDHGETDEVDEEDNNGSERGQRDGGSRYATRAFATPIFVASATPYFRTSATRTAATPKILL